MNVTTIHDAAPKPPPPRKLPTKVGESTVVAEGTVQVAAAADGEQNPLHGFRVNGPGLSVLISTEDMRALTLAGRNIGDRVTVTIAFGKNTD